ncbi:PP2C family protein-serine/threonine phosphatase [Marinigracilibium pacificum]|uniref:PP2C family protein-serine/threonine phosphatase n=1 Tax=Marinigracilibium pacificum TaxID=2729599 RepID=A0A848IXX1_9BACT|nr:PP2C family protein-serine/threonine phosphatase [Marinigracilibium pacificum]NMM46819.1 PP2C family protein-serine/threonine phosphatase [Marinigracilibium pacificum]
MLSSKIIRRLVFFGALFSWIGLSVVDVIILFTTKNSLAINVENFFSRAFLDSFLIFLFIYYHFQVQRYASSNFIDLLWRVFITGLLAIFVSIGLSYFLTLFEGHSISVNPFVLNIQYHINIGVISALLISSYHVFKRLILYQKTISLLRLWNIFEYTLLVSILLNFWDLEFTDPFPLSVYFFLVVMSIVLSVNMKWVAYLNFNQKLKSILLLSLTGVYLYYFINLVIVRVNSEASITLLQSNVTIAALFTFMSIYVVFSVLVLLFNLPTSSVFEQKLGDVLRFKDLSQTFHSEQKDEFVFDVLLNSSMSAVLADAGWVEITEKGKELLLHYEISESDIAAIKTGIETSKDKKSSIFRRRKIYSMNKGVYKSVLVCPINIQGVSAGDLVLLKEVKDGFNKDMLEIIETFTAQAVISIENARLMDEAIVNERYKEELKIAQKVSESLLPDRLIEHESYDITSFSQAADEVGGDYYDTFKIDEENIALVIADVSGKGTSAAFNMSQVKGVFHSLVTFGLDPIDFIVRANETLGRILEKNNFVTLSYFVINVKEKVIRFVRAGHCPTLYYNKKEDRTFYFKNKGLGLGIVRRGEYLPYVQENEYSYSVGDVLIVYTDGITEATNPDGEEFGYERLQSCLSRFKDLNALDIQDAIIREVYHFCDTNPLKDDYTMMVIKFK